MNIVVTGGTGFLGSHLVNKLRKFKKYNIHSVSRGEGIDIKNYEMFRNHLSKMKTEVMIHCAAHSGGIAYNALHEVEILEDNTIMGLNVVKACNELKINKLINIMPNCVYPGHLEEYEESKFWDGPLHESVLTVGLPRKIVWGSCFAYCHRYKNFKPIHLIFPNLYGPKDEFEPVQAHALGAFISKIIDAKENSKESVEIWGTGKPIREWLYVEDAAEAISRAIEEFDKFEPNEIMNIGVAKGLSIKELAETIKQIVGWHGQFVYNTQRPDGAMKKVLVADKMKKKLNWGPRINLEDGIRKTVEWYVNHKSEIKN